MNTSMVALVVLSSLLGDGLEPNWQSVYHDAQSLNSAQKKPMALIFGSGPQGWRQVAQEGKLEPPALQLLASSYVCVYADTSTPSGKKLAAMFEIQRGQGVVLSDRSGDKQAFWHEGQLSNQSLTRYLQKYADEQVAVTTTETVNMSRTSYYPSSYGATSSGVICTS
jgi:hypothetical protein